MKSEPSQNFQAATAITMLYFISITCVFGYGLTLLIANSEYIGRLSDNPLGWMIAGGWLLSVVIIALLPFLQVPSDFRLATKAGVARAAFGVICAIQAGFMMIFGPALASTIGAAKETPDLVYAAAVAYLTLGAMILAVLLWRVILIRRLPVQNVKPAKPR